MTNHKTGTREEWLAARLELLKAEKELTRRSDELARQRQELPWVRIAKDYRFETDKGSTSLADLFGGRSQLIIYHFMFGPGWKEGCPHCSFWADHYDSVNIHIGQRDTALAVVSRAPLTEIEPFKKRMGWRFKWLSSFNTDFNFDFNVSFTPEQVKSGVLPYNYGKYTMEKIEEKQGASAFYRDKHDDIYHTYSSYARGIDLMNTTYNFLDLTAKGRDENPDATQDWVRYHDKYKGASKDCCA